MINCKLNGKNKEHVQKSAFAHKAKLLFHIESNGH